MSDEILELLQIVSLGQIRALENLLSRSKNLDVNEKDEYGNFAAIIAARRNDLDMLKLLVEHGAKLDLKDGFGRTIMGWAIKYKNEETIKYINENK